MTTTFFTLSSYFFNWTKKLFYTELQSDILFSFFCKEFSQKKNLFSMQASHQVDSCNGHMVENAETMIVVASGMMSWW